MQTISVKCKVQVPVELHQEIDVTLQGFADACNQIYAIAKEKNCWNVTKLHHLVYKLVKESTGLKANHVCQAIRRVTGNAKAVKQVHKFRPTSINLDIRTFEYYEENQTVGVTLISGRKKFKLSIGNYQLALLKGQKPTAATLSKTKKGDYYINVCVDLETEPTGKTPKVIGVDLGRRDIATTSSGKSYRSGKSFRCGSCGFEIDADINAACNIAVLGHSVTVPESPGMICQLEGQISLFPDLFFELG